MTSTTPAGVEMNRVEYVYDAKSRLTDIVGIPNGDSNPSTRQEFVYDGLSRLRISRFYTRTATNSNWVAQPDKEKHRLYDGMDVVQERDANNAVTASITRDGNIGGILARSTPGLDTVQPIDQTGGMMAQAADQAPVRAKARLRQINWGDARDARDSGDSHRAHITLAQVDECGLIAPIPLTFEHPFYVFEGGFVPVVNGT